MKWSKKEISSAFRPSLMYACCVHESDLQVVKLLIERYGADVNLVDHPISIVKSIFHQIKNPNNHDGVNNENQILIRVFLYPVPRGTHYYINNVFHLCIF